MTAKTRQSQVQTKLRRCLLPVPPSIPDNAAWREGHLAQRAGVRCALYGEISAIGLRQRFGQRQAEAGSARAPASGRGDLAERLEGGRYVLFTPAGAGIAPAKYPLAAIGKDG